MRSLVESSSTAAARPTACQGLAARSAKWLMKLLRWTYGMADAPYRFSKRLMRLFIKLGFKPRGKIIFHIAVKEIAKKC